MSARARRPLARLGAVIACALWAGACSPARDAATAAPKQGPLACAQRPGGEVVMLEDGGLVTTRSIRCQPLDTRHVGGACADVTPISPPPLAACAGTKTVMMIEAGTQIAARGLEIGTIESVMRASYPRFRACFERSLKAGRDASGVVQLTFEIGEDGAPWGFDACAKQVVDDEEIGCIVEVARALRFAAGVGVTASVTYPIDFRVECAARTEKRE